MSTAMKKIGAVGVTLLIACASQTQELKQSQDAAVGVALRRGQFELSCATAVPVLLSSTIARARGLAGHGAR